MSEYFRVLKQLEEDEREPQRPVSKPVAVPRKSAHPEPALMPVKKPGSSPPALARTSSTSASYATLLGNLRALGGAEAIRLVVFASPGTNTTVRPVTTGLANHAGGLGLDVFAATLAESAGHFVLTQLLDAGGRGEKTEPLALDLHRTVWQSDFTDWLSRLTPTPDLVLLEGPPLEQSADAALLARACDGLVIVAETEVTPRELLRLAAERARLAECRTLGVVMHGTKDYLPAWLHRLLGGSGPAPLSSARD
ncbi:MAG: hypothetical protein HY699_13175 [Deltaproteobacteria bacterium]|nr:hypothetical protein [Deltaproteobacteria bacterium]